MWPQVRAGILLLVYVGVFTLSAPGMDSLPDTRAQLDRALTDYPAPLRGLASAAMAIELSARRPLEEALSPLQRPLRLAQEWALYGAGPAAAHRMEIRVDSVLVHRTQDPEHDWLSLQLRHRRIRPMVETVVMKPAPENRPGLERYILAQARDRWPEAQEVTLQFTKTPYHGEEAIYRVRAARAPGWAWKTAYRVKR